MGEGGARRASDGRVRGEGRRDRRQHAFDILHHIMVPEADHLIAFPLEEGRAGRIRRLFMLATINLHDQTAGLAPDSGEITQTPSPLPAANTIPLEIPKRILRGARFATITTSLPFRSSG